MAAPAHHGSAEPIVQVITPQRHGIPVWVFAAGVLFALLLGFACGFLVAVVRDSP